MKTQSIKIKIFIELVDILIKEIQTDHPNVESICVCGSSRFCVEISVIKWRFETNGIIANGLHLLPKWYTDAVGWKRDHHGAEEEGVVDIIQEVHLKKMKASDVIVICNLDGYIGDDTRDEIKHAGQLGLPVYYLESI